MKQISEKWYIDDEGNYYLDIGHGFQFYGKPWKENEVIRKIESGELALEPTPISIIDNQKIYHVYNPNVLPIPHFSILVERKAKH